ncbi:uncharacterized protein LOC115592365, partial [Scomber scombrus]
MPDVDRELLQQAYKNISDLKEDIRRLSDELQTKESLLSNYMDVASVQSKEITSLSTILWDTVAWDPAAGPQLSSCSTPKQPPWTEVAVRGRKRDLTASPPCLNLSNRFTALSADNLVHPVDPPVAPPRPVTTPADSAAPPKSLPRPGPKQRPSSRSKTSASRRRILREAVMRRSGAFPPPEPAIDTSPRDVATAGAPAHPEPAVDTSP